jgi:endonuclease YncB( thermonuclease family)
MCLKYSVPKLLLGLSLFLWPFAGGAADELVAEAVRCPPPGEGQYEVTEVIDAHTFRVENGLVVRLAGIEPPKPEYVRPGADISRLTEAARITLKKMLDGALVSLGFGDIQYDRYGRALAHVTLADGTWAQAAMIEEGLGRARAIAGEGSCLGELVQLERDARRGRTGIWRNAEYAIIRSDDPSLVERKGLYVLVEGRVVSVGRGHRVDFLNFGHHWRQDFTVLVPKKVAEQITNGGVPIESLAGRRVRIRGVVEEHDGPEIRLNDPGALEILGGE